ncbi:MAG TPA: class I SAM-dependent methyltransferase [Candidatus Dormibacteraeota bacterium]|nr:class I SAM-dependent methyltransferase [Candidatus Dormibacteraeota bacterium]
MSLISNVFFRLMYRRGSTPWDSGVSPPELVGVIEGARPLAAGRALDLGCGTGTTSVYMASNGWAVTGVDFVPRPIRVARAKAVAAGLSVAFLVGDVTSLHELPIEPGFDLLFDQGCFHSLPDRARPAYVGEVSRLARSGATFLLYAFGRQPDVHRRRFFPKGITPEEVRALFADFEFVEATPGTDPFGSHWYTLRRR